MKGDRDGTEREREGRGGAGVSAGHTSSPDHLLLFCRRRSFGPIQSFSLRQPITGGTGDYMGTGEETETGKEREVKRNVGMELRAKETDVCAKNVLRTKLTGIKRGEMKVKETCEE